MKKDQLKVLFSPGAAWVDRITSKSPGILDRLRVVRTIIDKTAIELPGEPTEEWDMSFPLRLYGEYDLHAFIVRLANEPPTTFRLVWPAKARALAGALLQRDGGVMYRSAVALDGRYSFQL